MPEACADLLHAAAGRAGDVFHVTRLQKPTPMSWWVPRTSVELGAVGGKQFVDEKILTDGVEGRLTS